MAKLLPGEFFLEKYEVLHEIGEGAFARVYKARHRILDRDVAIKLLQVEESVAIKRFEIEAKVISRLEHPATVRVHDYGVHGSAPYMVLEFVQGRTLRNLIDWRGAMEPSRVVGILIQLLGSLGEAHSHKVIHRDLKPRNIMVFQPYPDRPIDSVKVLDFGLAKVLPPSKTISYPGRITEKGSIVGTVRYMAPEQVRSQYVGPESDLFSIGLIAYEMLTGEHPYADIKGMKTAIEMLSDSPIEIPEEIDVASDLTGVINQMLQKDPDVRPSSARTILAQLNSLGGDTAELARSALAFIQSDRRRSGEAIDEDGGSRSYVSLTGADPFRSDDE